MTDPVPAAATGLPAAQAFDRRSFLATLAAAGVMTASATAPAIAADHPDAKLLELVAALFAAEARWDDLSREGDVIFPLLDTLMPAMPKALVFQEGRDTWPICYDPDALDRRWVEGEWLRCYTKETDARYLRWAVATWQKEGTGQGFIERAAEIVAAFDCYVLEVGRAKEAAGLPAHEERIAANTDFVDSLNREIASLPAVTAEGLTAKAKAAAMAWSSDLAHLGAEALPDMLRGEGMYKRMEVLLAVSVVVDAMKISATPALASSSERSAA